MEKAFSEETLREAGALLDCPVCEEPVTSVHGLCTLWGMEPTGWEDVWLVQQLTSSQIDAAPEGTNPWLHRHQP